MIQLLLAFALHEVFSASPKGDANNEIETAYSAGFTISDSLNRNWKFKNNPELAVPYAIKLDSGTPFNLVLNHSVNLFEKTNAWSCLIDPNSGSYIRHYGRDYKGLELDPTNKPPSPNSANSWSETHFPWAFYAQSGGGYKIYNPENGGSYVGWNETDDTVMIFPAGDRRIKTWFLNPVSTSYNLIHEANADLQSQYPRGFVLQHSDGRIWKYKVQSRTSKAILQLSTGTSASIVMNFENDFEGLSTKTLSQIKEIASGRLLSLDNNNLCLDIYSKLSDVVVTSLLKFGFAFYKQVSRFLFKPDGGYWIYTDVNQQVLGVDNVAGEDQLIFVPIGDSRTQSWVIKDVANVPPGTGNSGEIGQDVPNEPISSGLSLPVIIGITAAIVVLVAGIIAFLVYKRRNRGRIVQASSSDHDIELEKNLKV